MTNSINTTIYNTPAPLLCDFYKVTHVLLYPEGTERIYSNWTPRSAKYFMNPNVDGVVCFGIQSMVNTYFVDYFNNNFFNRPKEEVLEEYVWYMKNTLFIDEPQIHHIEDLHDLGYLPVEMYAMPEGTITPIGVPMMTIENTIDKFYWVTNFLETIISSEIWKPMTSATTAFEFKKLLTKYGKLTGASPTDIMFQAHDFSFRGMSGYHDAQKSGAAHLLSFYGTDTVPAISYLKEHYPNKESDKSIIGTSILATEHSIMCMYTDPDGDRNELEAFKTLLTRNPNGLLSVVSDTYNFERVITETLPKLKDLIMSRDGKLIIRPDSGNPVDIVCGTITNTIDLGENINFDHPKLGEFIFNEIKNSDIVSLYNEYKENPNNNNRYVQYRIKNTDYKIVVDLYDIKEKEITGVSDIVELVTYKIDSLSFDDKGLIETLSEQFGYTLNDAGFKELDSHIGAIYGDSINYERANEILKRLYDKGFASTSIVLGCGSYLYNMVTRDTLNFAIKATHGKKNGKDQFLQKDPKGDSTKKSLRGKVRVYRDDIGNLKVEDGLHEVNHDKCILEPVFINGKVMRKQSLSEIRALLNKELDIHMNNKF